LDDEDDDEDEVELELEPDEAFSFLLEFEFELVESGLFESELEFFDESSFEYLPDPSPASLSSRERLRVP